jgi:hypothetical protein
VGGAAQRLSGVAQTSTKYKVEMTKSDRLLCH